MRYLSALTWHRGCWNEAIFHPMCGRFAIQLDSDIYVSKQVIETIVDCTGSDIMVVGLYSMVNLSWRKY